jgi:hypothetical protein
MKKSVILNTEQVKRLQETGMLAVVELVKPQPHRNGDFWVWDKWIHACNNFTSEMLNKSPYQPGQQVYVRGSWGVLGEDIFVISECDKYRNGNLDLNYITWKSPATMPKSAARFFPVVSKVECVRCKDIRPVVRNKMVGTDNEIMAEFINRYGQSVWDDNAFIFITTFKIEK